MAAAEEDAIEKILKFEGAEKEMSKKIFEDVSKKREQKDKNHGINDRSCISTFNASRHLASTGEESLHSDTICWSEKTALVIQGA